MRESFGAFPSSLDSKGTIRSGTDPPLGSSRVERLPGLKWREVADRPQARKMVAHLNCMPGHSIQGTRGRV